MGNKLNQILIEINSLWENDLKMKKIDLENHSIVQLYAYFMREIIKNKKKSEEILRKLNEEERYYENKKDEGERLDIENLDLLLENQDLVIYSRTNEKGECQIIQCSNSIIALLGYSKLELIGKKIEFLMPSMYQSEHYKVVSNKIKSLRNNFNSNKELLKNSEKKQIFILPKTKSGYIMPINYRISIESDDDFSNTHIIKTKFELKDTKSVYGFYILTREDFNIDSISSSCLNLNLSMDILKKYMIDLNLLIRSEINDEINFSESYFEYEEEPRKVIWIYPDLLYPKKELMDIETKTDFEKEELIHNSKRKEFNLIISRIKFREDETLGYCFRLTNLETRRQSQESADFKINFNQKRFLMYDMSKLNYMRSMLVAKKTLIQEPSITINSEIITKEVKEEKNFEIQKTINKVKKQKKKKKKNDSSPDSSDIDEKLAEENLITKVKLQELSTKNLNEIKIYISELKDFGENISYFRREAEFKNSYEDHYHKFAVIKHLTEEFTKRQVDKKAKNFDRKFDSKANKSESTIGSNEINYESSWDFSTDATSSLNSIFNYDSITNIKYFSFFTFLALCAIISVEFFISISTIQNSNDRIFYSEKAFKILNGILYTKYFLTEAVMAQNPSYVNIEKDLNGNRTAYIFNQMKEMGNYHKSISETYSFFSNASITFSDDYYKYMNTKQLLQRTLSNGIPSFNTIPFSSAISSVNKK